MVKNKKKTPLNIIYLLQFSTKFTPFYILFEILHGIIMGLFTSADIIFVKLFYESLGTRSSFGKLLFIILIMMAIFLVYQIWFQMYRNVIRPLQQQKLQMGLNKTLFEHARKIDMSYYEKTEFYNDFIWTMNRSDIQISELLQTICNTITMIVSIITTTTVMLSINVILAIFTVMTSVLTVILQRFCIKIRVNYNIETNKIDRKLDYYERVFYTSDYAKELRISKISDTLLEEYNSSLVEKRNLTIKYNKNKIRFELPLNLLSKMMQPIVYLILLYQIMIKGIGTVSEIAVVFSAFWNLRGRIQAIIDLGARLSELGLYTEKIRTFIETEPKIKYGKFPVEQFSLLECNNISFGYTDDNLILKNINFTLRMGEKVALVGYNGSGKTTFVKLLAHLYSASSGNILYNGHDIKYYSRDSYIENIGIVFQDYQLYALSLSENVLCDKVGGEENANRIHNALHMASFEIDDFTLPNGINTELTKEFYPDGVNFSGGESQKIAISRIFAQKFDVIIMDEPSASLDPIAECELYKHIYESANEKAIIFISHRLSTTRNADRICMFENGRIIESGSHDELISLNGKYAEMFKLQAKKYTTDKEAIT